MTLVLGFAPFILFALLSRLSADLALWIAFAAAFVVTIRDFVERPALRLLDGTSLALFGLLALARGFVTPELTSAAVRALVDGVLACSPSPSRSSAAGLSPCNMPATRPADGSGRCRCSCKVHFHVCLRRLGWRLSSP